MAKPFNGLPFQPPVSATPGAVGRQGREAFPGITAAHVLVMQSGGYKALSPGWGVVLLMAEIRLTSWGKGSLSHYL